MVVEQKSNEILVRKMKQITPPGYCFVDSRLFLLDNFLVFPAKIYSLSHWLVGLVTATQHWAGVPVYKDLVLDESSANMLLALSYQDKSLFEEVVD